MYHYFLQGNALLRILDNTRLEFSITYPHLIMEGIDGKGVVVEEFVFTVSI